MIRKVERRHLCGNSNAAEYDPQVAKRMFGKPHRTVSMLPMQPLTEAPSHTFKLTPGADRQERTRDTLTRFAADERGTIAVNKDAHRMATFKIRSLSHHTFPEGRISRREKAKCNDHKKKTQNAKADMETQQVSQIAYVKKTVEGACNLQKVMDFKATLKRRYFFAKEVIGIFKTWAQTENGRIVAGDVERMSAKLGLPLNSREAKALITAMTKGRSAQVSGEEFCELLYRDGFFDQLLARGWTNLGDSDEDVHRFVREEAVTYAESELQRTFQDTLSKQLQQSFQNQVTGRPLEVGVDEFVAHAKALTHNWDSKRAEFAQKEFNRCQKNGKVNLREYWETLNGTNELPPNEQFAWLTQFGSPMEQNFYSRKLKREMPINQIENSFAKVQRVD